MSNGISYPSDYVAVAAAIDPQLLDAAALTSDWVSLKRFKSVMFVVNMGVTDSTLDIKIQSADDSSGTNNTDITGLAATQLSATDDNKQVVICVDQSEVNSGDLFVAVVVTASDATGANVSAVGIGFNAQYLPAAAYDVASVAEIKTLK